MVSHESSANPVKGKVSVSSTAFEGESITVKGSLPSLQLVLALAGRSRAEVDPKQRPGSRAEDICFGDPPILN